MQKQGSVGEERWLQSALAEPLDRISARWLVGLVFQERGEPSVHDRNLPSERLAGSTMLRGNRDNILARGSAPCGPNAVREVLQIPGHATEEVSGLFFRPEPARQSMRPGSEFLPIGRAWRGPVPTQKEPA